MRNYNPLRTPFAYIDDEFTINVDYPVYFFCMPRRNGKSDLYKYWFLQEHDKVWGKHDENSRTPLVW